MLVLTLISAMLWSKPPADPKDPKYPKDSKYLNDPKDAKDAKSHEPSKTASPLTSQTPPSSSSEADSVYENIVEGYAAESTESNIRYAAYANRIRTILSSAHRYVAYTSDIGESFRPIAHPGIVRAAYGISWLYILGDVSYEGYKSYLHNQRVINPALALTPREARIIGEKSPVSDATAAPPKSPADVEHGTVPPLEDYRTVMVQRAIFQSIASMGLPAFTIHSMVKYSGKAMKGVKSVPIRTWAPIGLGLSVVPFLPAIFDQPVENAVEWAFHKGFRAYGGEKFVGDAPPTGREDLLAKRPKEKEL